MQWMQEGQFDVLPSPTTTPFFEQWCHLHGRRKGGDLFPLDIKIFSKKLFSSFRVEKKISRLLPPLEKFWKNPLVANPWKLSFRRPRPLVFQYCVTCECYQFFYISLAKKVKFMFFINISSSKKHIKFCISSQSFVLKNHADFCHEIINLFHCPSNPETKWFHLEIKWVLHCDAPICQLLLSKYQVWIRHCIHELLSKKFSKQYSNYLH